jgi:hypothetical protein
MVTVNFNPLQDRDGQRWTSCASQGGQARDHAPFVHHRLPHLQSMSPSTHSFMLCRAPSCLLRNLFQRALSTYCSQSIAFKIFNVLLALFVVRRLIFLIHFIEGIIGKLKMDKSDLVTFMNDGSPAAVTTRPSVTLSPSSSLES